MENNLKVEKENLKKYTDALKAMIDSACILNNNFDEQKFNFLTNEVEKIYNNFPTLKTKKTYSLLNYASKRVAFLKKQLRQWEYEYYGLEKPTVDDTTYDLTLRELNNLESQFPSLCSKSSPTKTVGGFTDNSFKKRSHLLPMLSLSNVFNQEELIKFNNTIAKLTGIENNQISYNVEPKIDGLSISLIYSKGKLSYGVTRGDGKTGEDVTQNLLMIDSIPKTIPNDFDRFEVRGEIFISFEQFKIINDSIQKQEDKFANPRNAASGTLRRLDPELVKQRNLQMLAYYIPDYNNLKQLNIQKQSEVIQVLKEYGFKTAKEIKYCNNINEVYKHIEFLEQNQNNLDYPIDGAVVKEDKISLYDQLGQTSKFPHWATAYKFIPKEVQTKILDIHANVGRTGKITYVASLQPVQLSGSIISNATLNNAEYILSKDIRINDTVTIYKAAEIIPYVKSVILEKRSNNSIPFTPIKTCPVCGSTLEKRNGEVDQYCVNTSCKARILQSIIHFCSKNAMNIEGLSEKTITKFYDLGYIKNIEDIYKMNTHRVEIIQNVLNDKFKTFNKIILAIENSKNNSLERLIFGLGIRDVGATCSLFLARCYKNIDNLLQATKEELVTHKDIGEIVSTSIYDWCHNPSNIELINNLKQLGINTIYNSSLDKNIDTNSEYYQKNFCITGSFDIPRDQIKNMLIKKFDANVTSSVNKTTNYLIAGENAGSKIEKAKELGITIINNKIWES